MKAFSLKSLLVAAAVAAVSYIPASAQIGLYITEVDASSSGNSPYAADWFELTNTTGSTITLTGWKMDDNSNSSSSAVALRGLTSIGAGQSVIFFEGGSSSSGDAATVSAFNSAWGTSFVYGTNIGAYGGSGVGLSTDGDAVNLFNASNVLQAKVTFGASTNGVTFDNHGLVNNGAISQLSSVGSFGAYKSSANEIGSPGFAAIPEPSTYAALTGLVAFGVTALRRRRTVQAA